jgi:hypothetical protein
MPGLVDAVDEGLGVLSESSLLGRLPASQTVTATWALADPLVKTTLRESPGRRARRIEIRAPRRDLPEELLRALERACELQRLPRGWNSHGAEPVSDTAFRHAIEFLTAYVVRGVAGPALVPTVRGGVQLEWHRRGVDIEVEVGPDGSVSWCAEDRQLGDEVEAVLAGHEATVRTWLRRASD